MIARAHRFWVAVATFSLALLAMYFAAMQLDVPLLHAPAQPMHEAGSSAAALAVALLVFDVLLPVPASVVVIASGALFGLAVGATICLVGRAGAFLLGYWLGAKALPLARRFVPEDELAGASAMLERNGALAIVLSRPVPIVSETVAIVAGLTGMPLRQGLLAALAGSLPEALVLSAAGHYATTLNAPLYVFLGLLLVTVATWVVVKRKDARHAAQPRTRSPAP